MPIRLAAIETFVASGTLTNEMLAADFQEWTADRILEKTGIGSRPLASVEECASDLAYGAAVRLLGNGLYSAADVEYVMLCTQSPDYILPTTACLLQDRLGIPTSAGAVDINLGCSGYVYGLGLAKGLIESGQVRNVLLLTADTYSKYIDPEDRSVRTLFGDAGTATWLEATGPGQASNIDSFVYGTDGRGGSNLIVRQSGSRRARPSEPGGGSGGRDPSSTQDESLYMNGPEIFSFTMGAVPRLVESLLRKASMSMADVDHVVFHQANKYMLEHLRKKIGIPADKFVIDLKDYGNTVSSTIPLALSRLMRDGRASAGQRIMVVGFGVGYSWAGAIVTV